MWVGVGICFGWAFWMVLLFCYQKISLFLAGGLWISIILAKFAPLDIYSHH